MRLLLAVSSLAVAAPLLLSGCATETSQALQVAQTQSAARPYHGPRTAIAVGKFDNRSNCPAKPRSRSKAVWWICAAATRCGAVRVNPPTKWARASPVTWPHSTVTDASHSVSGSALQDMLSPQSKHGIAYGPRSPQYRP